MVIIPGGIAVSSLKFLAPPGGDLDKIDDDDNFSEVSQLNPVNTIAVGALGTAALGSVLW